MFYKTQCVVPKRITQGQFYNLFSSTLTYCLYIIYFRISHLNVQCHERDVNNVNRPQLHISSVCNSCCRVCSTWYTTTEEQFSIPLVFPPAGKHHHPEKWIKYLSDLELCNHMQSSVSLRTWTQGKSYSWGLARHLELTFYNFIGKEKSGEEDSISFSPLFFLTF